MIRSVNAFSRKKGIFCIEGPWVNDHASSTSVAKALEFLSIIESVNVIHKQCQNEATFNDLIDDAMKKKYSKNSILYLAFHGEPGKLFVGRRKKTINLDDVASVIGKRANGKIIHFGCCSTLNVSGWELRRFLRITGALAISGYQKDIDFLKSTLFDLLYFQQCQRNVNINSIKAGMKRYHNRLGKELGFVMKSW
jgi:hypothetical protein